MAPITREQALENALASSRIEGYEVTEQTRADCRRLMDGKVDARTLAAEILALSDDALAEKLEAERVSMAQQIAAKEEKLQNELNEL